MSKINIKFALILQLFLNCNLAYAQVGSAWAWNTSKITNNGSISLKSNDGSSSYSATQNPVGAVAKVNQSAVTQPPTVIIQATSGSSTGATAPTQMMPIMSPYAASVVPCPAGYTSIFSQLGTQWSGVQTVSNISGSRYSFGYALSSSSSSYAYLGFFMDNLPTGGYYSNMIPMGNAIAYIYAGQPWSANLCSK